MKQTLLLLFFGFLFQFSHAQRIGKTLDITTNYSHSYIEVVFTPYQGSTTVYWGESHGLLKNLDSKNVRFDSFANLIEYFEKFGWMYFEKFSPYEADNNYRIVFKREKE